MKAITRRSATRLLAGGLLSGVVLPPLTQRLAFAAPRPVTLSDADSAFLDEMERQACLYFYEQADPNTGQVLDRANNRATTGQLDSRFASSVAATGFGLTALCIADSRGYLPADRIRRRVLSTLQFHLRPMPTEHGFYYHFNDVKTGLPLLNIEVSPIDTAILLCGVLTCRAYFNDAKISDLATQIYNRVDWPWMLNNGDTFALGWLPATGFINVRWDHYAEMMMMYLLAIGSPTHPIDPSFWANFSRPRMRFQRFNYIGSRDPLFVHLYSHAWFDFYRKRDAFADYFANSVTAVRAHKAFCLSLNRGYTDDYWGVSASDWQHGYTAWGGPPLMGPVDGSVVPCATAGSLPFLPQDCLRVLRSLKDNYEQYAWGRYGPCDALHPSLSWYDSDVLGIDLGISLLAAENLRSGFVWKTFMQNPEASNAMRLAGFRSY
ncbi:glucoamylase family protein [Edaphobacter aggregans]|uniref:glucoamylase family protein n=1 Tax=Edaphobacter aggregans TaxID=570835 RepID=UPI0012FA97D7|nr:glucoamylase family protein [Edaphobacter aggregans]